METVESNIHAFFATLADAVGVPPPRVKCDVPISGEAQYAPARQQIQFADGEFLQSVTESGSAAPLRWGLHEFAHHIQYCRGGTNALAEDGAIEFTNTYVAPLTPVWQRAVVDGEDDLSIPASSIDPSVAVSE